MIPTIKWFQKKDKIILKIYMETVSQINSNDVKLELVNNHLLFDYPDYSFDQNLSASCTGVSFKSNGRYITTTIDKEESSQCDYLFKDKDFNKQYVKIDWVNWDDTLNDDGDDDLEDNASNNFDMETLQKMMLNYQNEQDNSDMECGGACGCKDNCLGGCESIPEGDEKDEEGELENIST